MNKIEATPVTDFENWARSGESVAARLEAYRKVVVNQLAEATEELHKVDEALGRIASLRGPT